MRKLILFVMLVMFAFAVGAIADNGHDFVGLKKCKMCHKGEKNGFIYEDWLKTQHAQAYNTLGTPESHTVYADLGHSGNPQEDPNCLKCHVTGYGLDTLRTAKVVKEDGITCESCHGAGGKYWKKKVMADRDSSIVYGLIAEPVNACSNCHNDNSPTFKSFNFDERYKEIEHKLPVKP
jgi:Cytochrome c554 and c-prime